MTSARKQTEAGIRLQNQELLRLNNELAARAAALEEANATISRIAATDDLTGLANRRHFYETLEKAVSLARRHGSPLAFVSLDLDGLKEVNDSAGHAAGDAVLTSFAALFGALCRAEDLAARLGGDEFGLLLPGIDLAGARGLAERVLAAVRSCATLAQNGVTASAGVAQWVPEERPDDLLRRADEALYAAKLGGGDVVAGGDAESEGRSRAPTEPEFPAQADVFVRIRETRRSLLESEIRYRQLFAAMGEGVALNEIVCDESGHPCDYGILEVNPAFEKLTGLAAGDIVGRTVLEVVPDLEPVWIERYGRVALEGEPMCFEDSVASLGRRYETHAYAAGNGRFVTTFTDVTERRRGEETLRESEALHRSILKASPDDITVTDLEGRVRMVSPAALIMFGYQREEDVLGRSLTEFLVSEDRERAQADIALMFEGVFSGPGEYRGLRADGSALFMEVNGEIVRGADGQPIGMVFIARDVTERTPAEDAMRHEKAVSDAIIDSIPGPFYMLDEDGRYVRWNSYQRDEIVGKSDDLIVATSAVDTIHPDDQALIGARIANVIENGGVEIVEGRVLLGGGPAFKWFLLTGRRIMIDDRPFLVGSGIDITDRKQAETELKHSRRLLHSSIESLSDTVLLAIDREYRYLTFNKAHWQAMHHAYGADIKIGANTLGFIGSDDDRQIAKEGYDRAMRGESYSQIAVYGTVHPAYYESFFNPILDDDDEIIGATCLSRDITERKRAEQALRASEEQLDRAIAGSGVGLWDWQIESDSAVFNERYAEMVGYTLGELAPLSAGAWMSLCHPDDRQRALGGLERHRTGQSEAYECEVRLRHKDGHWVWILDRGKATEWDGDGCATRMIGTHLDISARKQAEQALRESLGAQEAVTAGVIEALVRSVEARDPFTAGHQRRVSELVVAMAARLGLEPSRVEGLRVAGLLHDVGKITIPAEILSKPGRLTVMEFELIKGHAEAGEEILQAIPFPWPIAAMAAQHHEREDGSGYPAGLSGEAILPEARLLAVADVVEAMASHRPYRPAPGIEAALAEIHEGAGTRYDAAVVAACEQAFAEGFAFGEA